MSYKIIAICGEAGAGKDTLLRKVCDKYDVNEIISCTSRPMREGEIDGKNYYFLKDDVFMKKIWTGEMLECTTFNDWHYGTSIDALRKDKVNVGVFNIAGIEFMLEQPDLDITIVYVNVPAKERLMRQLNRETNPDVDEIVRRYGTDLKDFKKLNSYHHIVIDNLTTQDLDKAVNTIGQML